MVCGAVLRSNGVEYYYCAKAEGYENVGLGRGRKCKSPITSGKPIIGDYTFEMDRYVDIILEGRWPYQFQQ